MKKLSLLAIAVLLAGCGGEPDSFRESDTHFRVIKESLYNRIIVERYDDIVSLQFRVGSGDRRQSTIDLSQPTRLVIPYTQTMLAAAFVQPAPKRILQVGLGGAALNRFLVEAFPAATIKTVELDGEVLAAAEKYMGYKPGPRDEVVVEDGRSFLKRNKSTWDWILLDAFRGGAVPLHLKSREFYEVVRDRLAPGGVAVLNLHRGNRLFDSDLATLRAVFPQVHLFPVPETGNTIALAYVDDTKLSEKLAEDVDGRPDLLTGYLRDVSGQYRGEAEIRPKAQVLTDDFMPAEFLQEQKTGE